MKKFCAGLALVSVFLGGCAMSPQQLDIHPNIALDATESLQGAVSVTVHDSRPSATLGSRGGAYTETSMILTGDEFTQSIRSAVEQSLQELGFAVSNSPQAPKMDIFIEKLAYNVPDQFVKQVDLKAVARVTVSKEGKVFSGRYSSDISQKMMTSASDKKNEELVNKVVGSVLARVLNDPELRQFITL